MSKYNSPLNQIEDAANTECNPNFPSSFYKKAKSLKKLFNIERREIEIFEPIKEVSYRLLSVPRRVFNIAGVSKSTKNENFLKSEKSRKNSSFYSEKRYMLHYGVYKSNHMITKRKKNNLGRAISKLIKDEDKINSFGLNKETLRDNIRKSPQNINLPFIFSKDFTESEALTGW
jgi:hypothetical protein